MRFIRKIRTYAWLIVLIFSLPGCLSFSSEEQEFSEEVENISFIPLNYDIILGEEILKIESENKLEYSLNYYKKIMKI